jgi:hypothetical protein
MPSVTPELMRAFLSELEKTGAPFAPVAQKFIRGAAATGGVLGGVTGMTRGYSKARQEGQTRGEALQSGLKKGLIGAGIGAGAGAGIGALGKFKAPIVGEVNPGQAIHNFGGHTLHQWTGVGKASDFGGASAQTQHYLNEAMKGGDRAGIARAQKAHEAMLGAERMGLTSLPGAAKAFATKPGEAARAGWNAAIHGTTTGQKAMMFGLPVAMGAATLAMPGQDAEGKGRSFGSMAASTLPLMLMPWNPASMAMAMAPVAGVADISPSHILGKGLSAAGGAVGGTAGKVVKMVRGGGRVAPPAPQQMRQQVPGVQPPPASGGVA